MLLFFWNFQTAWTIAHCSVLTQFLSKRVCNMNMQAANCEHTRACFLNKFQFAFYLPDPNPSHTFYQWIFVICMHGPNLLCINNNILLLLSYVQCLVPLASAMCADWRCLSMCLESGAREWKLFDLYVFAQCKTWIMYVNWVVFELCVSAHLLLYFSPSFRLFLPLSISLIIQTYAVFTLLLCYPTYILVCVALWFHRMISTILVFYLPLSSMNALVGFLNIHINRWIQRNRY